MMYSEEERRGNVLVSKIAFAVSSADNSVFVPFAHLSNDSFLSVELVTEEAVTLRVTCYWRVFVEGSGGRVVEVDGAAGLSRVSNEVSLNSVGSGISDLEGSLGERSSGRDSSSRVNEDRLSKYSIVANLSDADLEVRVVHQLPHLGGSTIVDGGLDVVPVVGHEKVAGHSS